MSKPANTGLRGPALRAGAVAFVEKGAAPETVLGALRAAAASHSAGGWRHRDRGAE